MEKNAKKILQRADGILKKYVDSKSVYLDELKRSVKDYKSIELLDKTTNDLYLDHISQVCDTIVQKRYSNFIIMGFVLAFVVTLVITIITSLKYRDIANNLEKNIIKANSSTSLIVTYKDLSNFNAITLSSLDEYLDLKPLIVNVFASNSSSEKYRIKYNIYLVEQNSNMEEDELLSRDVFIYNVKTSSNDSGINYLKDCLVNKDKKILIYKGEIDTNSDEDVEIRMWIDKNSNKNFANKTYKFKLYIDGTVK